MLSVIITLSVGTLPRLFLIDVGLDPGAALRPAVAQTSGFVSGNFLNRHPIRPGDTHHYRDVLRLFNFPA